MIKFIICASPLCAQHALESFLYNHQVDYFDTGVWGGGGVA